MLSRADSPAGASRSELVPGEVAVLELTVRRYDDPVVRQLVAAVQAEYVIRYGGPDEAVVEDGEFDPPNGLFLVGVLVGVAGGTVDGEAVAMGGWRRMDAGPAGDIAEIKRMFVLDSCRGRGFARTILAELERTARSAGVRQLVLNTGIHQPEAIALYESTGYAPIPGFGYYADYPNARFYGKTL